MIEHLKKIGVFSVMIVLSTGIVFSGCKQEEEDKTGIQLLTVMGLVASGLLSGQCIQVTKTANTSSYKGIPIGVPRGGCNMDTLLGKTRAAAVTIDKAGLERQKTIATENACTAAVTTINTAITNATEANKAATEAAYDTTIGQIKYYPTNDAITEIKDGIVAAIAAGCGAGTGVCMTTASINNAKVMQTPSQTDVFAVLYTHQGVASASCKAKLYQTYPWLQQVPEFNPLAPTGQTSPEDPILPPAGNGGIFCQYGSAVTTTCATLKEYFYDGSGND